MIDLDFFCADNSLSILVVSVICSGSFTRTFLIGVLIADLLLSDCCLCNQDFFDVSTNLAKLRRTLNIVLALVWTELRYIKNRKAITSYCTRANNTSTFSATHCQDYLNSPGMIFYLLQKMNTLNQNLY